MTKKSAWFAIGVAASSFALAGCDAASNIVSNATDTGPEDPALVVSNLIQNDDPAACAHQTALDVAIGAVDRDYQRFLDEGGERLVVNAISARQIDKDVHEITCSGVLRWTVGEHEQSKQIVYKLRPSQDAGGGFVTEIMDGPVVRLAIMFHLGAWREAQKEAEASTEAEYADTEGPTETHLPFPNEEPTMELPVQRDQTNDGSDKTSNADEAAAAADAEAAPAQ